MPMVLRSRRSTIPDPPSGVELQATPRRRSTRPQQRQSYDEADESEPEAGPSRVMERHEADVEEEAAEEADLTVRFIIHPRNSRTGAPMALGWVQFRAASEAQVWPAIY
ncbi:hypothetical protein XENORESO_016507 [Xenotaenia resolanae]|uniref:Uncharacterized protein n=1 Tax=Xenotaenia resolanae TaxID=208358 RepID=A0ABV0VYQ7_9TELE